MNKKLVGLILFLTTVTVVLSGGTPEIAASEFEEWRRTRQKQFDSFRNERDRQFHKFLKKRWEKMEVLRGKVEDTAPKPVEQPAAKEKEEPEPVKIKEETKTEVLKIDLQPGIKPDTTAVFERAASGEIEVDYFGHQLTFKVDEQVFSSLELSSANREGIADFWRDFSAIELKQLISRLEETKGKLDLDGWGYMLLVDSLSDRLVNSKNLSRLVSWGLLLKSGYRVRTAYDGNGRIYLLYNYSDPLYQLPFFNLDGQRYYVFNPPGEGIKSLNTYPGKHAAVAREITIDLNKIPAAGGERVEQHLEFDYQGRSYSIPASYCAEAVAYMKKLPQLSLARYFELSVASGLGPEMLEALEEKIRPLSYSEAVDFLLAFVQKGFDYKTDQHQFGREQYMLPAESLYFPYSDCDDRAIFFSWLVRSLLKEEVYGLDYPGHAATAVEFPDPTGSYLTVNGRDFVIADPTYVNASAGMVMPRFSGMNPRLLP